MDNFQCAPRLLYAVCISRVDSPEHSGVSYYLLGFPPPTRSFWTEVGTTKATYLPAQFEPLKLPCQPVSSDFTGLGLGLNGLAVLLCCRSSGDWRMYRSTKDCLQRDPESVVIVFLAKILLNSF